MFFAQLAIAAYACPLIEGAVEVPAANAGMGAPCAEIGMAGPEATSALCLEHCKVGQQLVDNHSPATPLVAVPVLLCFVPAPVLDGISKVAQK